MIRLGHDIGLFDKIHDTNGDVKSATQLAEATGVQLSLMREA